MVAPSRLEKSEQLVNVAIHSPATTPEAARNKRDGRAESMTCTSILIQKSIPRAQLSGLAARDANPVYLVFWSIWSVSCEPNNKANSIDQTNQTDQIDEIDRIDQESRR